MKRKSICFLLVAALLFSCLSGCGSSNSKKEDKQADDASKIKILYPISRGMTESSVAEFEDWFQKRYPDVALDLVSASVTTVTDTTRSELKGKDAPDIFVTTEYDTFVNEGLLADLTSVEALTKYRKSSVRDLERDNKVYALPIGGGTMVGLHYNKTLFKQYGIDTPKEDETIFELLKRVQKVIKEDEDLSAINTSLLYPAQVFVIFNSLLASQTQTYEYLKWGVDYKTGASSFKDDIFQNYLSKVNVLINGDDKMDKAFSSDDYVNSQATAISSFLSGKSFMYIGDVKRCYDTLDTEGNYGKDDIGVMGIPTGDDNAVYVSYMDDICLGVNSAFDSYSKEKQDIILDILNYISDPDSDARDMFTFTSDYSSVYLENKNVETINEPYFEQINQSLAQNCVAQGISNSPFSSIFGKTVLAWKKGDLEKYMPDGSDDMAKVTNILEQYRTEGTSVYQKSEEPIGTSQYQMEYQSNQIRTQETALGNQVADMARDYMGADFALMNAGGIRASIPEGDVSVQTLNSVLPYTNYIVNIKISGATLKKALQNAYNVSPTYKSGQFGDISGLKVVTRTKEEGYKKYDEMLSAWESKNPNASEVEKNNKIKEIITQLTDQQEDCLNLEVVSVTDLEGNEIQDDTIYTVATIDYLLKDQDGYSMLAVLGDNDEADQSIEIYDREGNLIDGTKKEKEEKIEKTCLSSADSFVEWVKAGNELTSQVDGRLVTENLIYME